MKILFNNIIEDTTLTSLYGSLNYPVENLKDTILRVRFQSSIDDDYITGDFTSLSSINCFFYGFTNATFIEVKFYTGSDTLVYTLTINSPVNDVGAHHFRTIKADYFIMQITGSSTGVYIGGIGCGISILMPNPVSPWNEPIIDNTLRSKSRNGASLRDKIKGLRSYSWTFRENTREMINYFREIYLDIGVGKPLWIDLFHLDHDYISPIYAEIENPFDARKEGRMFSFKLDLVEAR